jgi:chemotaxis protein MotB
MTVLRNPRNVVFLFFPAALAACGHTEQEWQWQLDKLTRAQGDLAAAQVKLAQTSRDLETERSKGGEGPGRALSASLEERERALVEHRARQKVVEAHKARVDTLRKKLDEVAKLGVVVGVRKNHVFVVLPADQIFESPKSDAVKKDGLKILKKVAEVLKADPAIAGRDIQVGGHTDNKKVQGGLYKDNVGLSAMRAREVVAQMVAEGLPAQRWSAAGFGDADPLASNDTEDGKRLNRRVELVIVPAPDEVVDLRAIQPASVAAPTGP